MQLFAAAIGQDATTLTPVVVIMDFNEDFIDLFAPATTAERGLRWNNHLAGRAIIRQKSPLDIDRRTNLPFFTQLTSQLMLTMEWKETPLTQNIKYLGSQLTAYNYTHPQGSNIRQRPRLRTGTGPIQPGPAGRTTAGSRHQAH